MFFKDYLKGTLMWPQKRAGVAIYMLNNLAHDKGKNTWRYINEYSFSNQDLKKLFRVMTAIHDRIGVPRSVSQKDILKDWTLTLGSVYCSFIILIKGENPLSQGSSYNDLINEENYSLISEKIIEMQEYPERKEWLLCQHAKQVLEQNKKLSYLFKISFVKEDLRSQVGKPLFHKLTDFPLLAKQGNDKYSPNQIWKILGERLERSLMEKYPEANSRWLMWGFK